MERKEGFRKQESSFSWWKGEFHSIFIFFTTIDNFLENVTIVALQPPKKQRLPLSVARVQMKKQKERDQKMLQEVFISLTIPTCFLNTTSMS